MSRWKKGAALAVCFGLISAVTITALGDGRGAARMPSGADLLSALQARSPGERPDGALASSKPRYASADEPEEPSMWALPMMRTRVAPVAPISSLALGGGEDELPASEGLLGPEGIELASLGSGSGGGGSFSPGGVGGAGGSGGGGGFIAGGGGGGGGGGGTPPTDGTPVPPPPGDGATIIPPPDQGGPILPPPGGGTLVPPLVPGPAPGDGFNNPPPSNPVPQIVLPVPEPSSWLMMILGFGMVGTALRRARRPGHRRQASILESA